MPEHDCLKPFLPIGQFAWPALPTDDRLWILFDRLKNEILRTDKDEAPVVADDQLAGPTDEKLDAIAPPPACGPIIDELDAEFDRWVAKSERIKLVVLPPCEGHDIVATWARRRGLVCVDPPERDALITTTDEPHASFDGDDIIVIPRLENWFMRHQNGLQVLRRLLSDLSTGKQRVVVGCNSWAWAYLSAVMDIQLQVPNARTFQAFDQQRLFDWLSGSVSGAGSEVSHFRTSDSGADVFSRNEDDKLKSDFFQKLAAHSLGIPWIAWSVWRHSLKTSREDPEADLSDDDDETLWISKLADFTLPQNQRQAALLVLQSLLIHGPLTVEHLRLTLPFVGGSNVVEALAAAGFVEFQSNQISCVAAAYPAMRRELANAGFAMDVL